MHLNWLEKNTIFETVVGSQAYGTNNEQSDEDLGGVCIPPKIYFYSDRHNFEQANSFVDETGEKIDKTIYNLTKAVKLMAENNPNMMDYLFVPERCIKKITPEWEAILDIRDQFVSSRCKHTYQGYAHAQLERIRTHKLYVENPVDKPERSEFGLPSQSIFPATQNEVIAKLSTDYVDPNLATEFRAEVLSTLETDMNTILRKYLRADLMQMVIEDFKKSQETFVRILSSISSRYLKDEYIDMASKELAYLAAYKNWRRYETWKKTRNPKRQALEAKCGFDCYSSDTEFLTKSGWKHFDDITHDDELATVYIDGNSKFRTMYSIEYQKYVDRFDGTYTGDMYRVRGNHVDCMVTPNHRMLYQRVSRRNSDEIGGYVLDEVHSLPDSFNFLRTITPKSKNYSNGDIFSDLKISPATYLRIMGWFLSDGTFQFYNGKPKACVISQKKGNRLYPYMVRFAKKYKDILQTSIYTYKRSPTEIRNFEIDECVLHIRDANVVDKLYNDCGHSSDKHIPRYVFQLSKALKEVLFDSMVLGDGTVRNTSYKSIIYYSKSNQIANDVNELALLAGWETSMYGPYNNSSAAGECLMYHVHVNKNVSQNHMLIRNQSIRKEPVINQRIVCFTVPNKTLVTRRNGHVAFHGNSKHAMHLIRLQKMSCEILEGRGVLVDRTNIDREQLLDIRNGNWKFDQVIDLSNSLNEKADVLYDKSKLNRTANVELIDETVVKIIDSFL